MHLFRMPKSYRSAHAAKDLKYRRSWRLGLHTRISGFIFIFNTTRHLKQNILTVIHIWAKKTTTKELGFLTE